MTGNTGLVRCQDRHRGVVAVHWPGDKAVRRDMRLKIPAPSSRRRSDPPTLTRSAAHPLECYGSARISRTPVFPAGSDPPRASISVPSEGAQSSVSHFWFRSLLLMPGAQHIRPSELRRFRCGAEWLWHETTRDRCRAGWSPTGHGRAGDDAGASSVQFGRDELREPSIGVSIGHTRGFCLFCNRLSARPTWTAGKFGCTHPRRAARAARCRPAGLHGSLERCARAYLRCSDDG